MSCGAVLVEELASSEVVVVGPDVLGGRLPQRLPLFRAQRHLERLDDVAGDLLLDGEDVRSSRGRKRSAQSWKPFSASISWAVMRSWFPAFRTLPSSSVPTPRRRPNSRLSSPACRWTGKKRRARRRGAPERAQSVDDLLRDAFAEVVLVLLLAHVGERQNRDGSAGVFLGRRMHLDDGALVRHQESNSPCMQRRCCPGRAAGDGPAVPPCAPSAGRYGCRG